MRKYFDGWSNLLEFRVKLEIYGVIAPCRGTIEESGSHCVIGVQALYFPLKRWRVSDFTVTKTQSLYARPQSVLSITKFRF
jgi:hypothetical protein